MRIAGRARRSVRYFAVGLALSSIVSCLPLPPGGAGLAPSMYGPDVRPPSLPDNSVSMRSDPCSIAHREIKVTVDHCGMINGHYGSCRATTARIKILKDSVLYFDDPGSENSIVFSLGRTIDLKKESRQDPRWNRQLPPGVEEVASASAWREGDLLRLSWQASTIHKASGRTMAVAGEKIIVRTSSCSNTCKVEYFAGYMTNGSPQSTTNTSKRMQNCYFSQ